MQQSLKLKTLLHPTSSQTDSIFDNLILETADSVENKEAGCVANNYTNNIDLHNVNLYDIWKDATQAKPAVNEGKNALQSIVNNILPNDVSEKIRFTQEFGSQYRDIKNKMKTNLKVVREENCIFERYNVTLRPIEECLFYFNESGIGATNAASLSSNYFTMLTAAMMSDAGPGSGDIPFPAVDHNLSIPNYIMEYFGFNDTWEWSAKITVDESNNNYNANYNVSYGKEKYNMTYQNVLNYSKNKNKNERLNDASTDYDEKEKYVVFKELGDSMQNASYIAFVYYMCTNIQHLRYINQSLIDFCGIKENNKKCSVYSVNDDITKMMIKDELEQQLQWQGMNYLPTNQQGGRAQSTPGANKPTRRPWLHAG